MARKFKPQLIPTIIVLVLFTLMINLGFWQLRRFHEKHKIIYRQQSASELAPIPVKALPKKPEPFTPVRAQGRYLNNRNIILLNQRRGKKMGVEVITPLKIKGDDTLLLINRGWVATVNPNRIPIIKAVKSRQVVIGSIAPKYRDGFILGNSIIEPNRWPLKCQRLDLKEISGQLESPIYPYIVRLDPSARNGFNREWLIVNMQPEKHFGYMVQWFIMSLVLLVAFVIFSLR